MAMKRWSTRFYYDDEAEEHRVSIDIDFEDEGQCAAFATRAMKDKWLRMSIETLAEDTGGVCDAENYRATHGLNAADSSKERIEMLESSRENIAPYNRCTAEIFADGVTGVARVYLRDDGFFDCDLDTWDPDDEMSAVNRARLDVRFGNGSSMGDIARGIANALQRETHLSLDMDVDYMAAQLKYWWDYRTADMLEELLGGQTPAWESYFRGLERESRLDVSVQDAVLDSSGYIQIDKCGRELEYYVHLYGRIKDCDGAEPGDGKKRSVGVARRLPITLSASAVAEEVTADMRSKLEEYGIEDDLEPVEKHLTEQIRAWLGV